MEKTFNITDEAYGLAIDSRKVKNGDIFFCIKGSVNDGHDFAQQAIDSGAKYIVAHKKLPYFSEKIIYVNNTDDALIELTKNVRQSLNTTVIGITGTAGKTSTKEQILCAFQSKKTIITPASYNTIYGLGLTICNLKEDPEYLVLELGISAVGEMEILASIAKPDYSIITTIGAGHIGFFNDIDHIAKEKSVILKHTKKHAIFPKICLKYCPKHLNYSLHNGNTNSIQEYNEFPILEIAKLEQISNAAVNIKNYKPSKGRNNIVTLSKNGKKFTIIDGSFNSNPVSLKAAITQLQSYSNRKIAVLGEMRELGNYTEKYHKVDFDVDILLLLGKWDSKKGMIFQKYEEVCHHLDNIVKEGDVILLKGSYSTDIQLIVKYMEEIYGN